MKIVKQSENRFVFKGDITYWEDQSKSVEIDGEIYINKRREEVTKSVDELRKLGKHFYDMKYSFEPLDYSVKIEECGMFFNDSLSNQIIRYSENGYVNSIIAAYEAGLLDKRIKDMYCGKPDTIDILWNRVLNKSLVEIELHNYGFGNMIFFNLAVKDLFRCPIDKIPEKTIDLFEINGINLKSKNKIKEATILLKKKINKYKCKIAPQNHY